MQEADGISEMLYQIRDLSAICPCLRWHWEKFGLVRLSERSSASPTYQPGSFLRTGHCFPPVLAIIGDAPELGSSQAKVP